MTNLYKITKQIHELLTQINKKYGLDIKIKPTNLAGWEIPMCYTPTGEVWQMDYQNANKIFETDKYIPILFEPQIRQILVDLKDVLGENPKLEDYSDYGYEGGIKSELFQSQAEVLCKKWLDSLTPMFDREPEKVLQELVEVLKDLLK